MAGDEHVVRIGGRRLRLTNLDKVMYPETGTTKGEVIDYYTRIAPLLIPHVVGRPVTRKRWPEGVGTDDEPGTVFFAKDLERGAPSWVRRMPIQHSTGSKDYPLVGDVPTLVYLAQVASLELHVPQWRFAPDGGVGTADRIVLDLDPGDGAGLAECAVVARWARDILRGMGLDPMAVTSGSKGIHLYAALPAGQTSETASALAHELARSIEADHPDLVVSSMKKAERPGKVLIDWSQNSASKTTIAPYSLRGRAQPTVAAPRTWEELDDPGLRQLLFDEVLALRQAQETEAADDGPLAAYISKRTAGRTPEPVPANPLAAVSDAGDRPRFVIQEHHATALHWDLRLEHDGVFVSWAVPRGIPSTAQKNSLAIMTEDHPLEYGSFEGAIPRGQYGAGTVTIWDDGHYDLEKWRDDEVVFTAEGRPGGPLGRVRLALIRTDGEGEKSTWLLHRMKMDASGHPQHDGEPVVASDQADPRRSAPAPEPPAPVPELVEGPMTARSSPALRQAQGPSGKAQGPSGKAQGPSGDAQGPGGRPPKPMLCTTATPGIAREAAKRWARGGGEPCAEIKWDGVRALGVWDGSSLRLYARSGADITARYPEVVDDAWFGDTPAILDGEIVALDARGAPSFSRLQNRMHLTKPREIERERQRTPVRYVLFDALVDGVAETPLRRRRDNLERLAAKAGAAVLAPPVFDDVDDALAASRRFGLEGIVVKDPSSPYRPGIRSESWLKVKITHAQEVVIGGIRPGKGVRAGTIGSLLMGVQTPAGLHYCGRVGSGFSDATLARLAAALEPLRSDETPFIDVPAADASDALWVRPELVGEVEFSNWTPGGTIRHARWRGLRSDKSAADVVRED
ncbi:MAG: ATP-dependent DNA ligase [Microbacterium sp.]|uniref:ATP-dependent DNA ligase n=1 Tax=Microbacterium sp. TaxID=51671 RepID=UPI0039E3123C